MARKRTIATFYTPKQVTKGSGNQEGTNSPEKPKLLLEHIVEKGLKKHFKIKEKIKPFSDEDFMIAHTPEYVETFFNGERKYKETWIRWSEEFADSLRYTNSSLYSAIKNSIENPKEISFSPTSGFHHAKPDRGEAYCTFSGQVIASMKLFEEKGVSGAYLDLDAHFGNSIEDSRDYVQDLNLAIPKGANINPKGNGERYLDDLKSELETLGDKIKEGEIDYVVWCHGADSHEWDDAGDGKVNTQEWMNASKMFYEWVGQMDEELGRPLPLTISLFGGYRADDYNSVLELHTVDLVECLNTLNERNIQYKPDIKPIKTNQHY